MKKFHVLILALSIAGFLFSGYLTVSQVFSSKCVLNEGCPYFLGFPVCVYGFAMFSILLISSIFLMLEKHPREALMAIEGVSIFGIIFSGYFSIQELFFNTCVGGWCNYSLLLPSCVYGLAMYFAIFLLSLKVEN